MQPYSLFEIKKRHYEVPVLLALSLVTLAAGLILPTITLKELVFWNHTFSILTGIESLFQEKHYVLGLIVLLFSVIFPIVKLLTLTTIWFAKLTDELRLKLLKILGIIGKRSMLDVFIVAVILSIFATLRIDQLAK